MVACGGGEGPYGGSDTPYSDEAAVKAVIRDGTALLGRGDIDGFLSKQCPQVLAEVRDDPSLAQYLKQTYAGVAVRETTDVRIADDTATAMVVYEKAGEEDFPDEPTEVQLQLVDGLWKMC